eukprot:14091670-Alexandrium_andersonii.AAC.1
MQDAIQGATKAALQGAIQRKGSRDRLMGPFGARVATAGPLPLTRALKCGLKRALNCVLTCAIHFRSLIAALIVSPKGQLQDDKKRVQ